MIELLLAFLRMRVDDPPADPDPQDPPADPQPELDLDPADPDPAPAEDPKVELENARREAREAKETAERYQRELQEARLQRTQVPSADEDLQAVLKDPNATPQAKWKAEADLVLRQNTRTSQMTLSAAQDLADHTAFAQLGITEPALHKRYAAKVEEELGKARQQGYNPKREFIYNQLIAKDMRDGKFKKKAAPARDQPSSSSGVNRGKLPGARSDVSARQQKNEREARIERLRNQQI